MTCHQSHAEHISHFGYPIFWSDYLSASTIYSSISQFLVSKLLDDDYLKVHGTNIKNILSITILLAASAIILINQTKLVKEISNNTICNLFSY